MSPNSFQSDLLLGQMAEARVALLLAGELGAVIRPNPAGKVDSHDFIIERTERRLYECKADLRHADTKRCFFEVSRDGQPTGLAATLSDWWCHLAMPDLLFVMRPKNLLEWLAATCDAPVSGGDGGRTKGYLASSKDLLELCSIQPEWARVRKI